MNITAPDCMNCRNVQCQLTEHSEERDSHVLDIMTAIIETSYECIPVSKGPPRSRSVRGAVPGWKENVEPLRQDSLFWHSVWQSAGRPNKGGLHLVMAWARNKYHYAVRRAKKMASSIMAAEFQAAAQSGDYELLQQMKKVRSKKTSEQIIPDTFCGEVSEESIVEKFKELYEELYNSAGTEEAMMDIKQHIGNIVSSGSLEEVDKITDAVVKKACTRMKPGKLDVSEGFTSDVFLNAPDILFSQLATVFQSFLMHGTVSLQILCCAFMPHYKGGFKDSSVFKSYRALAGASQLLKLFEYVVLEVWGHLLSSDSMQFGYKKDTSTTQCSWLVTEVANYFVRRGTAVSACTLDCSMAFDKCKFSHIFTKLLEKQLPPVVVRVLIFVYEEQTGWVKLAGKRSSPFRLTCATRQGSVLSPAVFSVYLDGLITELRARGLGCYVGGWWMGACAFADDLFCLAPNRGVLADMLKVCEEYGEEHNLIFSTDDNPAKSKTKCIYFCGRKCNIQYPAPLQLYGKDLPWVESVEHLGHTLHQSCTMDQDCKIKRARFINDSTEVREKFDFAYPQEVLKAIQVYCCDGYGSMLWALDSDTSESYFKSWNTAVKLVYNVPRSTFTYLVEGHLAAGFTSLRKQIMSRYPTFFQSLLNSPSREVALLARIVARDTRSVTHRNVAYIKRMSGISPWDYGAQIIKSSLPSLKVPEEEKWRIGLLDKLFNVRRERNICLHDNQRITAMIDSLCNT